MLVFKAVKAYELEHPAIHSQRHMARSVAVILLQLITQHEIQTVKDLAQ